MIPSDDVVGLGLSAKDTKYHYIIRGYHIQIRVIIYHVPSSNGVIITAPIVINI